MNEDHLARLDSLRETLVAGDKDAVRADVQSMFADGVEHKDIAEVIIKHIFDRAVSHSGWLPSASITNLADSLVHVALQQQPEHKFEMMAYGSTEHSPRTITPPAMEGSLEELKAGYAAATNNRDSQLGECYLLGIAKVAGMREVFRTVLEALLQPKHLGQVSGPWWSGTRHQPISYAIELWHVYGDEMLTEIMCHRGPILASLPTDTSEKRMEAIAALEDEYNQLEQTQQGSDNQPFNEADFRAELNSLDAKRAFAAITKAWAQGVTASELTLAMTMHCVERLERAAAPTDKRANWDNLKRELLTTLGIRKISTVDETLAYRSAYHAAWQFVKHGDEGLGETDRQSALIKSSSACEIDYGNQDAAIRRVHSCLVAGDADGAVRVANDYVERGHDGEEFLRATCRFISEQSGGGYYAGQRGVIDAWYHAEGHPEQNRVLVALAGWGADYHRQHRTGKKRYGIVWGANLSDDGSLLALRSAGTRFFDATTGNEFAWFYGRPWRFAFSPDSRLLACGWDAETEGMVAKVQIWDVVLRKLVTELDAFDGDGKFWGLAFSPDGSQLAGCGRTNKNIKVWNTETWELAFDLVGHTSVRNESVTFSECGTHIASGGCDGTVRIWRADSGKSVLVFDKHASETGRISGLQFHPDGERIVSAQCNSETKIWNWMTGEESVHIQADGYCNYAGFSADGKTLITENAGWLNFWDADSGEHLQAVHATEGEVFGGANQSRDRSSIVIAAKNGDIKIWDVDSRTEKTRWKLEF